MSGPDYRNFMKASYEIAEIEIYQAKYALECR